MSWWQTFGTEAFPIRQSHLNDIASQNGCGKRFFYDVEAEATASKTPRERAPWKPTLGTAVHKVIERGLTRAWPEMIALFGPGATRPSDAGEGWAPLKLRARLDEVLREELTEASKATPADKPRLIDWYDAHPETEIAAGVAMCIGALRTTVERAQSIVACEAPFRSQLDVDLASGKTNTYHFAGTIDLIYRRRGDGAVCIADWKTGARRLEQVLLDFGYQLSVYAHACEHGVLWPRPPGAEGPQVELAAWPAELHVVHLRDFVPYVKKPKTAGKKVGDLRGPGWGPSRRTQQDVARLKASLRSVVTTVRMGLRLEMLGEQCKRCAYRGPCLGDGHAPAAGEARELAALLDGVDTSDAEDLCA